MWGAIWGTSQKFTLLTKSWLCYEPFSHGETFDNLALVSLWRRRVWSWLHFRISEGFRGAWFRGAWFRPGKNMRRVMPLLSRVRAWIMKRVMHFCRKRDRMLYLRDWTWSMSLMSKVPVRLVRVWQVGGGDMMPRNRISLMSKVRA